MVRTRIAPSPTGNDIHIGNLYTAMINYCFAHGHNGQFLIRIEDTDRTRLVEGAENKILSSLREYGINADESPHKGGPYAPYRQSDRLSIYRQYAEQLVASQHAYYCVCTKERLQELRQQKQQNKEIPRYDKHCLHHPEETARLMAAGQPAVIRLNVPDNQSISFQDLIRGKITINTKELDDQVLLKSDGFPTYHLAVVIDDYLMKISHVIRAEEWLPSTPKHILLYQAFGWPLPQFAHLPILRNPDHSKLSKRKNPVWAGWYLEQGILPEAMLNYLALMAWSHPQGQEIFDLKNYQQVFRLEDIQTTAPVFDPVKLEWLNGEYIRQLPVTDLADRIDHFYQQFQQKKYPLNTLVQTIPLVQTRMKKLSDYSSLTDFIYEQPTKVEFPIIILKQLANDVLNLLEHVEWQHQAIYKEFEQLAQNKAVKPVKLFMELRYALANRKVTAPLFEGMEIIGRQQVITRLKAVLA